MNVIAGERYKMVPKETKALVKGEYGKTPAPMHQDMKKDHWDEEQIPVACRFNSTRAEQDQGRNEEYLEQDEDVLSYALFPQVAKKYFEFRKAEKYRIDPDMVNYEDKVHPV